MTKEKIMFRMAARCEAAGRPNNEDNFQLDSDLSDDQWCFTADAVIELGAKGALLVVCDGMGGMNAGEVASDIAVRTIKSWFEADKLTSDVLSSPCAHIKQAIVAADTAIKRHSTDHPETEGMGSTAVVAWLLGKNVYVGWCGDSRCYCYNPKSGLVRLSHDHSYVQELVDAGKLTEDLAFDHPNGNIITRSLGDPNGSARPDTKEFELHNEDIIMLCSDGLCGCLRDKEIEEQIAAHQTSMQECRDALWVADEAAGWHDNVTIGLAQILSGGATATVENVEKKSAKESISNSQIDSLIASAKRMKQIAIVSVVSLLLVAGTFTCFLMKTQIKSLISHLTKQRVTENIDEVKSVATTDFVEDEGITELKKEDKVKEELVAEKKTGMPTAVKNEAVKIEPIEEKSDSASKPITVQVESVPSLQQIHTEESNVAVEVVAPTQETKEEDTTAKRDTIIVDEKKDTINAK